MILTPASLKKLCKELKLYSSAPELNDVLHLQCKGITKLENLHEYTGLKALYLEQNAIAKIENLEPLVNLRCLYLGKNMLEDMSGLASLHQLDSLDLSDNYISTVSGLDTLTALRTLNLSGNKLSNTSSVEHLTCCTSITTLDLANNKIEDTAAVDLVLTLQQLSYLRLMGNPAVSATRNCRKRLLAGMPNLNYLDDSPCFLKDRRLAEAFMAGGTEAERNMREQIRKEEEETRQRHRQAFDDMVAAARANPPPPHDPMRFRAVPPGESDSDEEGLPPGYAKKGKAASSAAAGDAAAPTAEPGEPADSLAPATNAGTSAAIPGVAAGTKSVTSQVMKLQQEAPDAAASDAASASGAAAASGATVDGLRTSRDGLTGAEASVVPHSSDSVAATMSSGSLLSLPDSNLGGLAAQSASSLTGLMPLSAASFQAGPPQPTPAITALNGETGVDTGASSQQRTDAGAASQQVPSDFRAELQERAMARAAARAEAARSIYAPEEALTHGAGSTPNGVAAAAAAAARSPRPPPVWGTANYRRLWAMAMEVGEQQEQQQQQQQEGEGEGGLPGAQGVGAAGAEVSSQQGAAPGVGGQDRGSLLQYAAPQTATPASPGAAATAGPAGARAGGADDVSGPLSHVRQSLASASVASLDDSVMGYRATPSGQPGPSASLVPGTLGRHVLTRTRTSGESVESEDLDSARANTERPAAMQDIDLDSARDGRADPDLDSARSSHGSDDADDPDPGHTTEELRARPLAAAAGGAVGSAGAGQHTGSSMAGVVRAPPSAEDAAGASRKGVSSAGHLVDGPAETSVGQDGAWSRQEEEDEDDDSDADDVSGERDLFERYSITSYGAGGAPATAPQRASTGNTVATPPPSGPVSSAATSHRQEPTAAGGSAGSGRVETSPVADQSRLHQGTAAAAVSTPDPSSSQASGSQSRPLLPHEHRHRGGSQLRHLNSARELHGQGAAAGDSPRHLHATEVAASGIPRAPATAPSQQYPSAPVAPTSSSSWGAGGLLGGGQSQDQALQQELLAEVAPRVDSASDRCGSARPSPGSIMAYEGAAGMQTTSGMALGPSTAPFPTPLVRTTSVPHPGSAAASELLQQARAVVGSPQALQARSSMPLRPPDAYLTLAGSLHDEAMLEQARAALRDEGSTTSASGVAGPGIERADSTQLGAPRAAGLTLDDLNALD